VVPAPLPQVVGHAVLEEEQAAIARGHRRVQLLEHAELGLVQLLPTSPRRARIDKVP